jgi:cell division protein FtsZ
MVKANKKIKKANQSKKIMKKIKSKSVFAKLSNIEGITRIKVIGIGGCGGNIVTRMMMGERPKGVEFVAINTDKQDLDYTLAHKKLYIGKALTKGLGAGMNPDVGKQAAEENRSEIGEILEDTDIVFLAAGMGGGTGTGATPVVAEIAKEKGILTLAFVTKPFTFEGTQRMNIAQEGIARLKDKVDSLVIIPNDRIFTIIEKETPLSKAFAYVDDVLRQAVWAVAELINVPGIINVDFADLKSILKESGTTLVGVGVASGQDRAMKAVQAALTSPLLDVTIDGAKGVLFSVAGTKDLKMSEINDIAKAISANLDPSAKVIFGAFYDRSLKDKALKVTVIATGFNGMFSERKAIPDLFTSFSKEEKNISSLTSKKSLFEEDKEDKDKGEQMLEENIDVFKEKIPESLKEEPWEIPAFLRKKRKK